MSWQEVTALVYAVYALLTGAFVVYRLREDFTPPLRASLVRECVVVVVICALVWPIVWILMGAIHAAWEE